MQNFRRTLVALSCLIVGAASFALSFVALRDVSIELMAVDPSLAFLVPIVIDGGIIGGSAVIWSYSQEQAKRPVFPFLFVAFLVLISVVVNASHAGPTILAKVIASLPPLVLLGVLELVAAQHRRVHDLELTSAPKPGFEKIEHTYPSQVTNLIKPEPARTTTSSKPVTALQSEDTANKSESTSVLDKEQDLDLSDLDTELETLTAGAWGNKRPTRKPLRVRAEEPE